jgi:hypothetical protein
LTNQAVYKTNKMKSSIKIDFLDKGKGLEPVIVCKLIDSDDTRDKLLRTFINKFYSQSNWAKMEFIDGNGSLDFSLSPITPEELDNTIEEIKKRIKK